MDDERGSFDEGLFQPERKTLGKDGQADARRPRKRHEGHRERLRKRFEEAGSDALADYELLEMVLFRSIPRADTKEPAKALIEQFGSIGAVLGASRSRLQDVPGVGAVAASDLNLIAALTQRMLRAEVRGKTVLSSWTKLLDYCRATMAYEERERFHILFLDKKNGLIRDECQQTGTVDHTPVYPREIVRRALELSASAVILVHNHPSGDPSPSRADIEMTKTIIATAEPMGIVVHDHIIIGKDGHASLKGMQLI